MIIIMTMTMTMMTIIIMMMLLLLHLSLHRITIAPGADGSIKVDPFFRSTSSR